MATHFQAIAAMAENRVIGCGEKIPWHLPEDFRWFKQKTMGHTIVMGSRTYRSIGRPLPGRETVVISRTADFDRVQMLREPESLEPAQFPGEVFICGGAEIYRLFLPRCRDLWLSHVVGSPEGDVFFPEFESLFNAGEIVHRGNGFHVVHYRNLSAA